MHGFRSTFRDWAGETRPEGRDVVERALAHAVRWHTENRIVIRGSRTVVFE